MGVGEEWDHSFIIKNKESFFKMDLWVILTYIFLVICVFWGYYGYDLIDDIASHQLCNKCYV